jgi:nicotinamidase-related amidase
MYILNMLLIIDMQYEFDSSNAVLGPVCKLVDAAIDNNETIIVVEYACNLDHNEENPESACQCRTHSQIMNRLASYPHTVKVIKENDGGGDEVIAAIDEFSPVVDVCGVNTDACVRDTVTRLARKVPSSEFRLVLEACNSSWFGQHNPKAHDWIDNHRNVRGV